MDGSDYTIDELVENLADLRRVNSRLGGGSALTSHLFPMIDNAGRNHLRILDVGTGSADIPQKIVDWARSRGIKLDFMVLDINEIVVREALSKSAGYPEISVVRSDANNLPFDDCSFDFVLASLFLHHFENQQAAKLIRDFYRVARLTFIINDLRRHPIAYYSVKLMTHIFTRNRLVRNDACLSVLRGFTERDIDEIAGCSRMQLRTFRHFPYRLIIIGQK
ncbi:MAG: methyltransferase domain-containing protein [Acidobacteria bacterium]|nr:methyltransferase domain-containing protein [Acidobacteriota bacterium]